MNNQSSTINYRRFWLPLLFQVILILVIPAQAIYIDLTGKTVILQTIPVDPYDLLRGYSQTLRYDISDSNTLKNLPGWETLSQSTDRYQGRNITPETQFYVILQAPTSSRQAEKPPLPWKPIAVSKNLPNNLPADQVAIKGKKSDYPWIDYGLETYYFPEDQRQAINTYINQTLQNSQGKRPFVVEIKVDSQGKAIPISLWVGDKNYRF